jgi:deoxyribonuclease V
MKFTAPHAWDVSPKRAIQIQNELRCKVAVEKCASAIHFVAGADICLDGEKKKGFAGVIVYKFPELEEVERQWAERSLSFPYIPGLLAFREAPILLEAFAKIRTEPDVVVFDGQGIAHPRRFGIASHMGVIIDKPTVGCAKSLLTGTYSEPGERAGDWSHLMDGEEVIGIVLRSRDRVNPIFVSVGHKIDLDGCRRVILQCCDGVRIPKPTREADRFVARLKAGERPAQQSDTSQLSIF